MSAPKEDPKKGKEQQDPPKPPPTEAELEEQRRLLSQTFFGGPPPSKPEPEEEPSTPPEGEPEPTGEPEPPPATPEKPAAAAGEPAKPTAAPATPAAPAGPAKPAEPTPAPATKPLPPPLGEEPSPQPQPVSEESVRQMVDNALSRGQPAVKLTEDQQEKLDAAARLEKERPDDYAGLRGSFMRFWQAEANYIQRWTDQNPDKEFDPDSDEHDEFYRTQHPKYKESDLNRAIISNASDRAADRAKTEARQEYKQEMDNLKEELRMQRSEPAMRAATAQTEAALFRHVSKEFAEIIGENKIIDDATKAKMMESNPVLYEMISEDAEPLKVLTTELQKVQHFPNSYRIDTGLSMQLSDGTTIYPHRELVEMAIALDRHYASLSPEQAVKDGKRYASNEAFEAAHNKILNSNRSEADKRAAIDQINANYWTVMWPDVYRQIAAKYITKSQKRMERLNKLLENRGEQPNQPASRGTQLADQSITPQSQSAPQPAESSSRAKPAPALATASDSTTTRGTPTPTKGLKQEDVEKTFFG